jgi:hypothetical protein
MKSEAQAYGELAHPSAFCQHVLKLDLYPWQIEALDSLLEPGSRTALRTCNESGKTSVVVAGAIIWHMVTFPNSLAVSTAGVFRQVCDQLMPNLTRLLAKYPRWVVNKNTVTAPCGSRYIGFSTDDSGRFEGWHTPPFPKEILARAPADWGQLGTPPEKSSLMIVIDEAKSVDRGIFDAVERCRPDRLLVCSSPGIPAGPFYDCFNSQAHRYKRLVVPYQQCPHLMAGHKLGEIEDQIATFGREHPLVRSMVFAEFADDSSSSVFRGDDVEWAMSGNGKTWGGERRAALDLSGGGDEQPLLVREGNRLVAIESFREADSTTLVDRLIATFRRHELRPEWITADNGGIGEAIIDQLHRKGWPVQRLNFGDAPRDTDKYANLRAELYFTLAHRMQMKEVVLLRDEKLKEQLLWQQYLLDERGKLRLVPKARMPGSPDRADALAMLYYEAPHRESYRTPARIIEDYMNRQHSNDRSPLGMNLED